MSTRSWSRVVLDVSAAQADDVAACCIDLGSCGVHTEETGARSLLHVYFEGGQPEVVRAWLLAQVRGSPWPDVTVVTAAVEPWRDWGAAWRRFYRPVWATDRIVVHPPWMPVTAGPGQVGICIDPAMAFGTGGHESTRLALRAIEACQVAGATCLDLGTGSGVLAIALVRLGAARVVAVDTDPVAVDNARLNVAANLGAAAACVRVCPGSVEAAAGGYFDLVVANLESRLLRPMLGAVAKVVDGAHGRALFSGLLEAEADAFAEALEAVGLRLESRWRQNGWFSCRARRAT